MTSAELGDAVRRCIAEQAQHGEVSQQVGHTFTKAVIAFIEVSAMLLAPRTEDTFAISWMCIPRQ